MTTAPNPPGATPVLMPQPGQSMEEGTIVRWLVQEGDRVTPGDILFEVETDKAVLEVEAADAGRLARIVVRDGETVPVKTLVAVLAETDADADAFLAAQGAAPQAGGGLSAQAEEGEPAVETATATAAGAPAGTRVPASPLARRAAAGLGVALESIAPGSGPRGRIVLADVERASHQAPVPQMAATGGERQPMSRMRRAIARNLQASKQTVPHFYMKATVDAGALLAYHAGEKALYPCSLNDLVVLACARLLVEFPAFRTRIDGDDLVTQAEANIGIAVGTEDGLLVPVLRGADGRSLKGIAQETRRLAEAARAGRLEGAGEGAFTVTNLGMFGVEEFSAIINPPESAILAVGAAREAVIVRDGALRAGHTMALTLSADHRVIDGILAARFLARLKELLENPGTM